MTYDLRAPPGSRSAPPPPTAHAGGAGFRIRLPLWAGVAGLGALVMAVVLWQAGAMRSGEGARDAVPVIAADGRPFRLRADDNGQAATRTPPDMSIYDRATGRIDPPGAAARVERLRPPPENPLPPPQPVVQAPPVAQTPATPSPAAIAAAPAEPAPVQPAVADAAGERGAALVALVLPPIPPAAIVRGGAAQPAVAVAPVAAPASPARPAATPASAPAATAPQPAARGALIQLSAVGSEADARKEWDRLRRAHGDLLGRLRPSVSPVDVNGRTLYRLRAGAFPDRAEAVDVCTRLRSRGASCMVPVS